MDGINATNVGGSGLIQSIVRKSMKAGEKTREAEEAKRVKEIEELVKSVPKIDYVERKIVEGSSYRRYLDIMA